MAFDIILYNSTAEPNRVNKSGYLTTLATVSGTLRGSCSLLQPEITVELSSVPHCNYAYIGSFFRYYFIRNITSTVNGLWLLSMQVDVLYTYRTGIRNLSALVERSESDYNDLLPDPMIPQLARQNLRVIYQSSIGNPFINTNNNPQYILSVVGGSAV